MQSGACQSAISRKRQSQLIAHGPSPKKKVRQVLDLEEEEDEAQTYAGYRATMTTHRRTAMQKQCAHEKNVGNDR